ncbi:hypothetical protein EVA_09037 [gut metagenome]|uniref:Uncharacterized protein n=1 Tax=gut metagenome TaxID=749906 RepID=J9GL18_9ZZZZ
MELIAYLCFVVCVGCHAHDAADLSIVPCFPFARTQEVAAFVQRETKFRSLLGYVDLQQATDDSIIFFVPAYQFLPTVSDCLQHE